MATESKFKMSQERYDALKAELQYLETDKAKEVSEQIKEARSFGDLSENSEYDEAKTEQGKLYSKIAEIQNLIDNAEIVERMDSDVGKGGVTLGSVVKVRDSPIGRVLYGHVAGDKIDVEAPAGTLHFEIISVENG